MGRRQLVRLSRSLLGTALVGLGIALVTALGIIVIRLAARPGPALLGLGAVLVVAAAAGLAAGRLAARVPRPVVLELDLSEPAHDGPATPERRLARRGAPELRDIVETLERAGRDERVAGLLARVDAPADGLADAQELRDAVTAFRASGKFAVAYADSFGEFAGGDLAYYVATAFDEVAVQPSGGVGITGVSREYRFFRDALDKLGVKARFGRRHEYKNATEVFTERGFTPAHREATLRLVESQFEQLLAGISAGRGLGGDAARALVDEGPLSGEEARDGGLIDRLAYRDEVIDGVRERTGGNATLLYLARYRRRAVRTRRRATTVAVIHGSGAVTRGRSRLSPLTGRSMGADTVASALRAAVADRRVRAILFRIDSPGGSYVGSDTIWREVVRAREAGKPVVASLGNVAASGGYFVAMAADRIVAHPGTLTGSIGVLAGKPIVAGLLDRLGIGADRVTAGAHAGIMAASRDFEPGEWDRLQDWLDRVYDDFTGKVASGRGLSGAHVAEVARGRVWTGADAAERGLVDELGGYRAALDAIRSAVGLGAGDPVRLVPYPRPRSSLARLRPGRAESSEDHDAAVAAPGLPLGNAASAYAAMTAAGHRAGLGDGPLLAHDLPVWPRR